MTAWNATSRSLEPYSMTAWNATARSLEPYSMNVIRAAWNAKICMYAHSPHCTEYLRTYGL